MDAAVTIHERLGTPGVDLRLEGRTITIRNTLGNTHIFSVDDITRITTSDSPGIFSSGFRCVLKGPKLPFFTEFLAKTPEEQAALRDFVAKVQALRGYDSSPAPSLMPDRAMQLAQKRAKVEAEWAITKAKIEADQAAKRDRLVALSPAARKRRKVVRTLAIVSAAVVAMTIAFSPGTSVGITGWQNPTGKTVMVSVTTYDPDTGSGLNDYMDRVEWRVRPYETTDADRILHKVSCSGNRVGIMLHAWNVDNDLDGGFDFTTAKCGTTGRCGVVLDLDLNPRLSGCQI